MHLRQRTRGWPQGEPSVEELGLSRIGYYQRLNALLDQEEALQHDPLTVNRLCRLRASRMKSKSLR